MHLTCRMAAGAHGAPASRGEVVESGFSQDGATRVTRAQEKDVHIYGAIKKWRFASRSEEHTSELQSLMRISYAVFCLKKKNKELTMITNDILRHNSLIQ